MTAPSMKAHVLAAEARRALATEDRSRGHICTRAAHEYYLRAVGSAPTGLPIVTLFRAPLSASLHGDYRQPAVAICPEAMAVRFIDALADFCPACGGRWSRCGCAA